MASLNEEFDSDISDGEEKVLTGRKALISLLNRNKQEGDDVVEEEDKSTKKTSEKFLNKQRVLILSSRGITHRYRHLMKDLHVLLPHSRKDAKFDSKGKVGLLNEIADLHNCNNTLYFEIRKNQDLYLWMAKTPHGPTMKFHIQNVHTMDELKLTGNCLKGSRPLLSFDRAFDTEPHLQLIKEMFMHIFGTPKGHRKSKPFFDHIFSFSCVDGRIWFRNYQIANESSVKDVSAAAAGEGGVDSGDLIEIGPRFTMCPIAILAGGFGGQLLYENPDFIHPNKLRAMYAKKTASKYVQRTQSQMERQRKLATEKIPKTEMTEVDNIFRAAE